MFEGLPRQGHPLFYKYTKNEENLHEIKNRTYAGDGNPLGNFQRVGNFLAQYPGLDYTDARVVCLMYQLKHIDAIFWALSSKAKAPASNVIHESAGDISVYMKLLRCIQDDMDAAL